MRIDLNLARDPFRNRSLFWLGMAAAYLVAFTAFMIVVARAAHVGTDAEQLVEERATQQATIAELEARLAEIGEVEGHAIFSDADRAALDDARELLIARSFSWSRLLGDLEPHVPASAKLTSIQVKEVSGEGANRVATLTVAGRGKDFGQLGAFIASLEGTGGRFTAFPLRNGPDGDNPEFVFEAEVRYRPTVGAAEALAPPAEGRGDV
jgi:Tfp pilus assembly protein PilN